MAEKTEKATPKKLRDARKKGQVAKSQDLPSAFTFIVSIAVILATIGTLFDLAKSFLLAAFNSITQTNLNEMIIYFFGQAVMTIFYMSMPVLVLVCLTGVIINFLAIGPVFSLEAMKPDVKKFDPIQNLKAKFKFKTLFELLKSIAKISIAAYIIYLVMYKSLPVLITMVKLPLIASLMVFDAFLKEVLWKLGLFFITIAIVDFVYQRRTFAKDMKMEKFEVKQEYKNTEGDPQIKSKRKQMAHEIANEEGPAGGVKKSKAVVTNPTHFAIAIAYDRELDQAPWIAAKGKDKMAEQMIKLANDYGVPVLRNVTLARKLWQEGELQDYVPEDTYEILAEILRWVEDLDEDGRQTLENLTP